MEVSSQDTLEHDIYIPDYEVASIEDCVRPWSLAGVVPPACARHFFACLRHAEKTLLFKDTDSRLTAVLLSAYKKGPVWRQRRILREEVRDEVAITPENAQEVAFRSLLRLMQDDMATCGKNDDERSTFSARCHSMRLVLNSLKQGADDIAAFSWEAHVYNRSPVRVWSPEQSNVLEVVGGVLEVDDANELLPAARKSARIFTVTGGPGTGKTEVILECAVRASNAGSNLFIGASLGLLTSTYRSRIPPDSFIVMETLHAGFKLTRKADEYYCPPGRLRHYDLMVFDECSQIDDSMWNQMKAAIGELSPFPVIVFVGDFQQLQPCNGESTLVHDLARLAGRGLVHIELQQHEAARITDPT